MDLRDLDRYQIWRELLNREWSAYKESPVGVFSVDGYEIAEQVGQIIGQYSPLTCLDVGCGCLPMPSYMKTSNDIKWFGIDPFAGDQLRQFDFIQGCAESLPYPDEFFNGVLFASSIDHLFNPENALQEAHRVLKPSSHIFVWFSNRVNAPVYESQGKIPFNKMHLWGFNDLTLKQLIEKTGFSVKDIEILDSQEHLLIAERNSNANP